MLCPLRYADWCFGIPSMSSKCRLNLSERLSQRDRQKLCFQMDSSALLDVAVRSRATHAEQDAKTSPTPVIKSKKTSLTAKLKSPAPIIRVKKLSFDKTTAEKGIVSIHGILLGEIASCSASDFAYCNRFLNSVVCCLSSCQTRAPCLNHLMDLHAIWQVQLLGSVTHRVRWHYG